MEVGASGSGACSSNLRGLDLAAAPVYRMRMARAGGSGRSGGKAALQEEEQQRRLGEAAADPRAPSSLERIREALGSRHSLVAARAAHLVREHALWTLMPGCEEALAAAFRRFVDGGQKTDAGCRAKLAALEALDYGESRDEAVFVEATRVVQLEAAWGPPVDTAGGVRARGLVALARLGYPELDVLAAERLLDGEPGVRQAALDALGHRGGRDGAGLALYKLRLGDEEPQVTLAAMGALLALAPQAGLEVLGALLSERGAGGGAGASGGRGRGGGHAGRLDDPQWEPHEARETRRELAALALGQSRLEPALALLRGALEEAVTASDRAPLLKGLGLHRSDGALEVLLGVIEDGAPADAEAAEKALAPRRYEPAVERRLVQVLAARRTPRRPG